MNGNNKLINTFNNTIEALEEYIEKIGYSGFKKQIFDKSINSPDRSPADLADDFLSQLHCLKAMIWVTRKNPEYSHQEVQKIFYQWIEAAGIRADTCPKDLKHYIFTINEILENRGENFVQQINERDDNSEEPSPEVYQEIYSRVEQELRNPSERKEINIQGNAETGKEIFQQIVSSLSDSDRRNFRFYSPNAPQKTNPGLSWPVKLAIGGATLAVLVILIIASAFLISKLKKRKK